MKELWRKCWIGLGLLGLLAAPVQAGIVLNEILANNVTKTELGGSTPDWVELYNNSPTRVSLSGLSLTSDPLLPRRWVFPEGTYIEGNGYLQVYCDANLNNEALNTGFGLNADGDALYLYDTNTNVVNSVVFGMQIPDLSIGRLAAKGGAWGLCLPTKDGVNVAATVGSPTALKVNEWMADPVSGSDWFELYNSGPTPVELGGLYLTDDATKPTLSPIPALSFIGTGDSAFQKFIADGTPIKGPSHVGFKLSKSGSALMIFSGSTRLDSVTFGTQALGVSQGRLPDGGPNSANFAVTPTPGESNYLPLTNVVINEILAHTDPPLEDAVELYNPTGADVSIGGWFLSDSPGNFKKYRIPNGTLLKAHGYAVFFFAASGDPADTNFFNLNSSEGEAVYLSQADAAGNLSGYRTDVKFGPTENGVSFGRFQTSVGFDYAMMSHRTFGVDNPVTLDEFRQSRGATNAYPLMGPVVINEIMYHPAEVTLGIDNTLDEFIELRSVTNQMCPLYHPLEPTNTWRIRGGVDFDFPMNVTLAPGEYALVVSFEPTANPILTAAFRNKYGLATNVLLFGPYSGKLSNAGDKLDLQKPDSVQGAGHINLGYVPYVSVDKVEYADTTPWPATADGMGNSLQRLDSLKYANDPANWVALLPTAGRGNFAADTDGDGMPDDWELAYGLNPFLAADASDDADLDGLSNLQEYLSGTDPRNPQSVLKVANAVASPNGIILQFQAIAGKTYTVQYRDSLTGNSWLKLQDISSAISSGMVAVTNQPSNGMRYYRLVTPALP